jgi:hypothetical protein
VAMADDVALPCWTPVNPDLSKDNAS